MGMFGKRRDPELHPWGKKTPQIDTDKRYDVYYSFHQSILVYRDVKFKGLRSLSSDDYYDSLSSRFWLVEQADGSEIFLPSFTIMLFCEHGTAPNVETWAIPAQ